MYNITRGDSLRVKAEFDIRVKWSGTTGAWICLRPGGERCKRGVTQDESVEPDCGR